MADLATGGAVGSAVAAAAARAGIPEAATADLRNDLRAGPELFGMTVFSRHSIQRQAVKM
jgi:hypothetical protein